MVIAVLYGTVGCQSGEREEQSSPDWHLHLANDAMDREDDARITNVHIADINVLDQVYLKNGTDLTEDTTGDFQSADASMEITSKPKHGTAALGGDGTLVYTPNEGYAGSDSVAWSVKLKQAPETVTGRFQVLVDPPPPPEPEDEQDEQPAELPGHRWAGAYENCDEARAEGHTPVRKGEEGYAPWLDSDWDGVGCEWG
ncbi:excalibur calcium-binding domain-containing protein [Streptomyces tendae]